jgi:hypothetical protein
MPLLALPRTQARHAGEPAHAGPPCVLEIHHAVPKAPPAGWMPAIEPDGVARDGAWAAELSALPHCRSPARPEASRQTASRWPWSSRTSISTGRPYQPSHSHPRRPARPRLSGASTHLLTVAFVTSLDIFDQVY